MSTKDYKILYFKYKNKYLNLRKQIGGVSGVDQGKCTSLPDFCDVEIHGETGTSSFFIKDTLGNECAEITLKNNDQKLFIADIKVGKRFGNCSYNFKTIIDTIERKAKEKGKQLVTLEDNSYMQFPERYNNPNDAPFKWDLAFVKNGGLSLYEIFGYEIEMTKGTNEEGILRLIIDLTAEYNKNNTFNLVAEGKKLELTKLLLFKAGTCIDASKCYSTQTEYDTALTVFTREFKAFNDYLVPKLVEYTKSKDWVINGSEFNGLLEMGVVSIPTKYHSLIKNLNMNYYKKILT